ncbi:hypothetical protein Tco_1081168 [Tanacetum coccineum]|uniref:RNA-directed DNA polymerase, eukaryota n=1 Tax=Tanacetum coccineum TaxID=301880 RepID=A0ABQ5HWV4_9ASTR
MLPKSSSIAYNSLIESKPKTSLLRASDLGIHGLGLVIVAIGKKLVVVLVGIVETVPAFSVRLKIGLSMLGNSSTTTDGPFQAFAISSIELRGAKIMGLRSVNSWLLSNVCKFGNKWGCEALDIEDNFGSSFARKRLCILTKQPESILEKFKVIFKGKVFVARAKELFTWNPMTVESDDECNVDGVSETVFSDNVDECNVDGHGKETDKQQSEDLFGFYDLLNKLPAKGVRDASTSLSHPPGFTPKTSVRSMIPQWRYHRESVSSFSHKVHNGGSILDILDDMAANRIGCAVLNTPFRYLGVMVGECMSRKSAWVGLVNKLKARFQKDSVEDYGSFRVVSSSTVLLILRIERFRGYFERGCGASFWRGSLWCNGISKRFKALSLSSFRRDVGMDFLLMESRAVTWRRGYDLSSAILNSVVLSSSKDRWTCVLWKDGEFKVNVIRKLYWMTVSPFDRMEGSGRVIGSCQAMARDRAMAHHSVVRAKGVKTFKFKTVQEAARKDIERAFGGCPIALLSNSNICVTSTPAIVGKVSYFVTLVAPLGARAIVVTLVVLDEIIHQPSFVVRLPSAVGAEFSDP